jgi:hypothetical protein
MRDWRGYVTENLGSLRLDGAEAEEVACELAGHLAECYEALRAQGLLEEEAFLRTCAEVGNWKELRRGVISVKEEGTMVDRVKQIWVPSLVTLLCSFVAFALLTWAGKEPVMRRGLILYVPWLLILPLIGAAGGYLSRRAQGVGWRVYVAGAFPAVAIAVIFLITFPFAFAVGVDPRVVPGFKFTNLVSMAISWVIVPGIALWLGVVLQNLRRLEGTRR